MPYGVDIHTISHLLGYNQVSTTQIYARISTRRVVQEVNRAFNVQLRTRFIGEEEVNKIRYPEKGRSPIDFLQMQVLRGEINKEEYREKLALLKESGLNLFESATSE